MPPLLCAFVLFWGVGGGGWRLLYPHSRQDFFHNIVSIVMFAVLGTLVSTFIIGYLTYLAGKLVSRQPEQFSALLAKSFFKFFH